MSEHTLEELAAVRLELGSLRARQEVLADALAAAGDELEKLALENELLRQQLAVVRGGTDPVSDGPAGETTA